MTDKPPFSEKYKKKFKEFSDNTKDLVTAVKEKSKLTLEHKRFIANTLDTASCVLEDLRQYDTLKQSAVKMGIKKVEAVLRDEVYRLNKDEDNKEWASAKIGIALGVLPFLSQEGVYASKEKDTDGIQYFCYKGNEVKICHQSTYTAVIWNVGKGAEMLSRDELTVVIQNTIEAAFPPVCTIIEHQLVPYNTPQNLPSALATGIHETLIKASDLGMARKIFLHGPPGTGKSTVARQLTKLGNRRTLYINASATTLADWEAAVSGFNPDLIVFEDIDRGMGHGSGVSSSLLNFLESVDPSVFVVATANNVNLDMAVIRPGRFDEVIQVLTLGPDALASLTEGYTEQERALAAPLPAAYINEVNNRRTLYGKQDTLAYIEEMLKRASC